MNGDTCVIELPHILRLQAEEQMRIDSALQQSTCHTLKPDGMNGIPLPYRLNSDWMVTSILFLCFILLSYVLAHGKKHLEQEFSNFLLSKERASLFDDSTASDVRYTLALIFQTCVLSGFCLYDYFSDHDQVLFETAPRYWLLTSYMVCALLFFILKWFSYSLINWIFFNKTRCQIWIKSYFNVIIGAGLLLFPVVLLMVYFDLSPQIVPYYIGSILIFAKILLLYKCFSNFFNKIHGIVHLIVYFYALEILPDFVLWKGILLMNNIWVLNF